jgi:PAS domain S-box-containing protein
VETGKTAYNTAYAPRFRDPRGEAICELLQKYAAGDLRERVEINESNDDLEAINECLNMFAEKLEQISEQKRIDQEKLLETQERHRLLIQNIREYAVYGIDASGRVVSWNPGAEFIKGYREEEILEKPIAVFYTNEEVQNGKPEVDLSIAKEKDICQTGGWRVKKDGSVFWAKVTLASSYDRDGVFIGFTRVTHDNSAKKAASDKIAMLNIKLEENLTRLEEGNSEIEAFSYSVSHDLLSPLRAIHSYTKILANEYSTKFDEEGRKILEAVTKNSIKMSQLIDDLLTFSWAEKKEHHIVDVDMTAIAEECIDELIKGTPQEKKITINLEMLLPVKADAALMHQVFQDLLSNAFKYSRREKVQLVEIKSFSEELETVYSVTDNGVGFDMKYYHQLFCVFHSLHDNDEFEGTGVGLALVKQIILRHNGRVWALGEPGKGARFYFSLPNTLLTSTHREVETSLAGST